MTHNVLLPLACLAVVACEAGVQRISPPPPPGLEVDLITKSAPIPLSTDNGLALMSPDVACVFDSYEVQIACGDPTWSDTVRFGRRGAGPGELGSFGHLVSGPGSAIGFVDREHDRLSLFSDDGFLEQIRLPALISPAADMGSDSAFYFSRFAVPGGPPELLLEQVHWPTAAIMSEQRLTIAPSLLASDSVLFLGAFGTPSGDWIAKVNGASGVHLVRYSNDGALVGLLDMPDISPILPSERDVEEFLEYLRRLPIGRTVRDSMIDNFRSTPLPRIRQGMPHRSIQVDGSGSVYVLANQRSSSDTYIEVYDQTSYVGSIAVEGRVLAMQILDSVLVTLAEDMTSNEPMPARHLHWYRIVRSMSHRQQ